MEEWLFRWYTQRPVNAAYKADHAPKSQKIVDAPSTLATQEIKKAPDKIRGFLVTYLALLPLPAAFHIPRGSCSLLARLLLSAKFQRRRSLCT